MAGPRRRNPSFYGCATESPPSSPPSASDRVLGIGVGFPGIDAVTRLPSLHRGKIRRLDRGELSAEKVQNNYGVRSEMTPN